MRKREGMGKGNGWGRENGWGRGKEDEVEIEGWRGEGGVKGKGGGGKERWNGAEKKGEVRRMHRR